MQAIFDNLTEILETWWDSFNQNLPQLIAGLLVLVFSVYFSRLVSRVLKRGLTQRHSDPELTTLLTRIVRWMIVIIGIILALEQAGQDVSALIAGLGIIGFTLGFALQDVSANFAAGMLLLYQQPFELGDTIEVGGYGGKVKDVDLRATKILTFDGLLVMIPNQEVYTNTITNFTRVKRRRLEHTVSISHQSDVLFVEKLLLDALNGLPFLLKDPAPEVKLTAFGAASIDLAIYFWYDTKRHGFLEANNLGAVEIKKALEKAGVDMPFPTYSVIVNQT